MTAELTARSFTEKAINGHDPAKSRAHWWFEDSDSGSQSKARLDSISDENMALFEAMQQRYLWPELEPTVGNYDFSKVQARLDHCTERGIPLMIWIGHRGFGGVDAMPADLVDDWQVPSGGVGTPTACIFHATPRTALINLCKALIDRFKDHPFFLGLRVPGETAGQATVPGDTYSLAKEQTGWNTIWTEVSNYCPYLHYWFGFNFLTGVGGGATDQNIIDAWAACTSGLSTDGRITFVTPDILLPGAEGRWDSLKHRVYPVLNPNFDNDSRTGLATNIANFRRASSMMADSYRYSSNAGHAYFHTKGDPTYGDQVHDYNGDGELDMHEQARWGIDELGIDIILWGHIDFPGTVGTNITVMYTFDRTTHSNAFGSTYGDAIGAVRQQWWAPHNPFYRDGPLAVSAVVDLKNEFNVVTGVGPARSTMGVFYNTELNLQTGDMWSVTSVSTDQVAVTPEPGGIFNLKAVGAPTGAQSFNWAIVAGPNTGATGTHPFEVA